LAWTIELTESAKKQLHKMDSSQAKRIIHFLHQRIESSVDPRQTGKPLSGTLAGLWRYRVGDYRLVCELRDEVLVVLVVNIKHRREVYR
jgi:mRNA interferase RelE/StbE